VRTFQFASTAFHRVYCHALREVLPQAGALRIELNDGSILQAGSAKVAGDRLEVSVGTGTNLSVVGAQVSEIKKSQ